MKGAMLLCVPSKKNQNAKGDRFLVTVTVLGSTGPIRFVVSEDDLVAAVIDTALKSYARAGRLPVLSSDFRDFCLFCPNSGPEAISPWDTIGSVGDRDFMLWQKPEKSSTMEDGNGRTISETVAAKRKAQKWKSWIHKSSANHYGSSR